MKKLLLCLLLVSSLSSAVLAADGRTISLKDGSSIQGDIISLENGSYKIHSSTLGEITIPEADIISITTKASPAVPTPTMPITIPENIAATPEFQSVHAKVMGDPQMIGDIQQLMQDPEVMAILADPSFLAAVQSGNTASLQSDPRLKSLSENPKVQALIQKIQGQ